ncbi:MFS transporter [uncultured Aureimonas sp.]|uniref:MFS transporter n=1 Tax=uncultured Aureimonas sp. TaxID=1604662 RepID=UPI0025DF06F1|nr:MFS transporter [uncultured Aureimonas sp.]
MTHPSAPAVRPADLTQARDRAAPRVGLALASLSLGSFVIGAGEFGIMGLLPTMASDLGVSIPQAGLLVTGYALGVVFGAPLLAVLTSRWERRRTLFLLALVFFAGNLACALAPTYTLLMAARLFTALAHGAFFGIGAVLAAEIARPGKEAQAISMLFVGMTLANVFGVPLGTVIGQAFGWRSAFFVVSALAAATAAMIYLFVPVSRPRPGVRFAEELRALVRPPVLLAMSLSVLASSALFVLYTYIAPLLVGVTGLAETSVPYLLFVLGTGMTIGNLAGAKLADWKLMPSIMGLFAAMAAILVGIHVFASSPVVMVALMLLWGMVVFGLTSPIQMRIVATSLGARNLASTINQSAFNLGNAFGAWVGAMMISAGLGYDALPLAAAALALSALGVAAVSWRMDGRASRG